MYTYRRNDLVFNRIPDIGLTVAALTVHRALNGIAIFIRYGGAKLRLST